jgi:predicted NUDIX family NTP pyrophosphohydrolase
VGDGSVPKGELDRLGWVTLAEAQELLLSGQVPFLDRLVSALEHPDPAAR